MFLLASQARIFLPRAQREATKLESDKKHNFLFPYSIEDVAELVE